MESGAAAQARGGNEKGLRPYWQSVCGRWTIYHGDARQILPAVSADVLVTDPPYGIDYQSGMTGHDRGTALPGIVGDDDTSLRDMVLSWWGPRPAVVFGSWKRPRPEGCKIVLTWEKGDHVGMGDLSLPWKPNTEEVYILGSGFSGHRGSAVLYYPAPVSWNSVGHGRMHPHQKPDALMVELISKCPPGVVLDPFLGSGTTLVACVKLGRPGVGIEIDDEYCRLAARRADAEATHLFAEAL